MNSSVTDEQIAHRILCDLVEHGGAVVPSSECSVIELADARLYGRFYVRSDGLGFVRRETNWLRHVEACVDACRDIDSGDDDVDSGDDDVAD